MERLFSDLSHAVSGAALPALGAAVLWGVLSILLSPCHLASIPLIVGFINGQGRLTRARAVALAGLFALGILLTIALIGVITGSAGRLLGDVGPWGGYLVAGVFFLVGLHLLDVIPLPWSGPGPVGLRRKGALAAFLLGLVFGVALGPCTFAFMAPLLAVALQVSGDRPVYGALLLAAYGLGHCGVIVLAGGATGQVQRYLDWNERSRGALLLRRACGVLVLLGGLYMIWVAPAAAAPAESPSGHVVAYYFHGDVRCQGCLTIESYTDLALRRNFAAELAAGDLVWAVTNIDLEENAHFSDDFALDGRTVVLAEVRDGEVLRWKNLERVWEFLDDAAGFERFVVAEVRSFREGAGEHAEAE